MRSKCFLFKVGGMSLVLLIMLLGMISLAAGQEEVEYVSWQWLEPGKGDLVREFAARFEAEYPQYKIKEVPRGVQAYDDKLFSEMAVGTPPDIFISLNSNIAQYHSFGFVEPLGKYVDFDKYYPPKAKLNPLADVTKINGKVYGVPWEINPYPILRNTRIFKETGSAYPTNMYDFFNLVRKLNDPPNRWGYAEATDPASVRYLFEVVQLWLTAYMVKLEEDGRPILTDPTVVYAFREMKRWLDAGVLPKELTYSAVNKNMTAGNIAMTRIGPFIMGWIKAQNPEVAKVMDYGPAFWPSGRYMTWGLYLSVPTAAKHKEGAGKFIEFMLREENQREYVERGYTLTTTLGIAGPEFLKETPWFRIFAEMKPSELISVVPGIVGLHFAEYEKLIGDAATKILYWDEPVEKVLREAQNELDALEW